LRVVEEAAGSRGARVLLRGRDFRVTGRAGELEYRGLRWHLRGLRLGLLGGFQQANLALALAALEVLEEAGWRLPEESVRRAVSEARWPGRLEVLGTGPRVVLDGAHNPHASRVLARSLREDLAYERLWLVLGILGDKDARGILGDLEPLADELVLTRSSSARAREPREIERLAVEVRNRSLHALPTVPAALDWVLGRAQTDDLVCVTGSLTTVGDARAHLRALGWVR
ncbi:MAG: cyanophycin synthetase, partial [Deferrisomatales bacterium]|nr:cyanophycin synthetase [Deferrisomatales bacterium]